MYVAQRPWRPGRRAVGAARPLDCLIDPPPAVVLRLRRPSCANLSLLLLRSCGHMSHVRSIYGCSHLA